MPVFSPTIYILINEFSSFIFWEITNAFGILFMDSFNQEAAHGSFQDVGDVVLWTWMVVYREKFGVSPVPSHCYHASLPTSGVWVSPTSGSRV